MDTLNQILRASSDINLKGKISCQNHFVLLCDTTAKSFTVYLPDAKAVRNICLVIVKTDTSANTVTVQCEIAGQKVNGAATAVLALVGASLQLFPCGADGYWYKTGDGHVRSHDLAGASDHSSTITPGAIIVAAATTGLPKASVHLTENATGVGVGSTAIDKLDVNGAVHAYGTAVASRANEIIIDVDTGFSRVISVGDGSNRGSFKFRVEKTSGADPLNAAIIDGNADMAIGGNPVSNIRLSVIDDTVLFDVKDTREYNNTPFAEIDLSGKYTVAGDRAAFAAIRGYKENATVNDADGKLSLLISKQGAGLVEGLSISSDKEVTLPGLTAGLVKSSAAGLLSIASAADIEGAHTHSKLVASDGSPDPALSANAAGNCSTPYDFGIGTTTPTTQLGGTATGLAIYGTYPAVSLENGSSRILLFNSGSALNMQGAESLNLESSRLTFGEGAPCLMSTKQYDPIGSGNSYNVFVGGGGQLINNSSAYNNTSFGITALNELTSGTSNTAFGYSALSAIATGSGNIGIGGVAGYSAITNINCVYIGNGSNTKLDGSENEIVIGRGSTGLGSNTIVIGNVDHTLCRIFGDLAIGTSTPKGILHLVKTDSQICTNVGENTASSGTFTRDETYPCMERADSGTLTDDGVLDILNETDGFTYEGLTGFGFIKAWFDYAGGALVYANFSFHRNVVTITDVFIGNIGNVVDTDTDGNLCIIAPSERKLQIKNRLGSAAHIGYWIKYWRGDVYSQV